MVYGKHFASMYTGSMVGAGFGAYAVMGYVIANQVPDRELGFYVELNARVLAAVFGEPEKEIERAIEYLCAPDPSSRTLAEGGRRLIKKGQFAYQVVNGKVYHEIRNEDERRRQNREAQQRRREKQRGKAAGSAGKTKAERLGEEAAKAGDVNASARLQEMLDGVKPGAYGSVAEWQEPAEHPHEEPAAGV